MYFIGLDLGKSNDYSAVCIAQRTDFDNPKGAIEVNNVDRFPLGTPYTKVAQHVGDLIRRLPDAIVEREYWPMDKEIPRKEVIHDYMLIVDATGVGNAVVELLRAQRLRMDEVVITSGVGQDRSEGSRTYLPKVQLISPLRVAFESGRLKIATQIPHWRQIESELMDFDEEISGSGAPSYGNRSANGHDDMVLAMALAVWKADKMRKFHYGF